MSEHKQTPARAASRAKQDPRTPTPVETLLGDGLAPSALSLLDVAERLFALHGIEKVSFRDLVAASGQRNVSAVTYHFGSREGLLGALLSRRLWLINKMHLQRLQVLTRLGKAQDAHAVISELFRVTSDAVRQEPWAAHFVLVNAQVLFHPELNFKALVPSELLTGIESAQQLLAPALPHLTRETLAYRAELAHQGSYFALAKWLHANGAVSAANEVNFEAFVANTVDFLVGGVTGPVTP